MKLFQLRQTKLERTAGTNVIVRSPGLALLVLFGLFLAMLFLMSIFSALFSAKLEQNTAFIRILSVIQDVCVFILPAIVTAIVATKLPATFLGIDAKMSPSTIFYSIAVLICAFPALNFIIALNESIRFPEALGPIEAMMREMENAAKDSLGLLQGGNSVGSLIISILIIGVLAGFSEELFFRGALQKILCYLHLGPHAAIWITAIIFSLMHFQFYGFIPRLLLGAYFGYLVWWSGSLWSSIIVHVTNNSIVVFMAWITERVHASSNIADELGATLNPSLQEIITIVLSVTVTILGIYLLRNRALKSKTKYCIPSNSETIKN